ncbi:unnamed protein product, partial [Candidula unifasciata]
YNKTWAEYLHGFEIGEWHWWLGLENILAFNQMGHRTIVLCIVLDSGNFAWEFRHENFTVNEASSGFSFTSDFKSNISYGPYPMSTLYTPEDIIRMSQGVPFSSPDIDRDNDINSCAALHGAGWWFNNCAAGQDLNPLGFLPSVMNEPTEYNRLLIPGVKTDDREFVNNFESFLLIFVD